MATRLLIFTSIMTVSTLFASFTPLYLTLSPRKTKIIEQLGVGILLGAGLGIIIPEGVQAVYSSLGNDERHGTEGHGEHNLSSYVGLALLLGFVMMYLIDSFHPHDSHSTPPQHRRHSRRASVYLHAKLSAELSPLSGLPTEEAKIKGYEWEDSEARIGLGPGVKRARRSDSPTLMSRTSSASLAATLVEMSSSNSISTVLGLLLHSLADGIALGASSVSFTAATEAKSLDLIIFLAVMLHKAPTAFALSTLLLASPSNSKTFIKNSLLAFSLASPLAAIATYGILSWIGSAEGMNSLTFETGMVLTFSGGSFLFVATGAANNSSPSFSPVGNGIDGFEEDHSEEIGNGFKVLLVLAGMGTPLFLSRLVGHGH